VPDARHDRHGRAGDLAHQLRTVEGPQVFQRTAATHQQQHVQLGLFVVVAVGLFQRVVQGSGRLIALDQGREHHHRHLWRAPAQRRGYIAQGGGVQGRDHANAARQLNQGPFARSVEIALGLQLGLEAHELLKQAALPRQPGAFDDQLQVTARAVDVQSPLHFHHLAVAQVDAAELRRPAKHGTADLALLVFE